MSRGSIYLLLAIGGAVLPWFFFADFFANQASAGAFVGALFANGATGGFTVDLLISSVVFWIFFFPEARRVGVTGSWVFVVVNLLVGLACALPLFLWRRERALARTSVEAGTAKPDWA
jgi:hypothetical protein